MVYELLIEKWLKRLSLKDINDFANKNGMPLKTGEDKVIYDFIMNYWKEVYKGDANKALLKLKPMVSQSTYNNVLKLYNNFKDKIK